MKDALQLVLVSLVILGVGILVYTRTFDSGSADVLTIRALNGEVTHETSEGEGAPEVGTILRSSDRILTGVGGRVELSLGERAELTLGGESALALVGNDSDGIQVELEDGLVQAVVRPGSGPGLSVAAGGRVVRAQDAEFSVGLGRDGTAAVESRAGQVTLVNFGDIGSLESGEQVVVSPSGESVLAEIPKSLLLEVAWPTGSTRSAQRRIAGRTAPGATVWTEVRGKRMRAIADSEGNFVIEGVPLEEGDNAIEVNARGLLGSEKSAQGRLERDSEAPTGAFRVEY